MGRRIRRLTQAEINKIKGIGRHAVSKGLYLQISKWDTKSWIFRYQLNGVRRELGLGSVDEVSTKKARAKVAEYRDWLRIGIDPKLKRDSEVQEKQKLQSWTFDRCAKAYISAHAPSWKNLKHAQQWKNTLAQYASPVFGSLPVEEIDNSLVMKVIEPIWYTKTETATRLRGRIERILSWAIVRGYRANPNPAQWRGNLSELLPKSSDIAKETHHSALPYAEISIFMKELDKHKSISAQALKFTILSACRTGEVIAASWDEIDVENRVWTIPKERSKSKREHRVPLTDSMMAVLSDLPRLGGWVFPSNRAGRHISNNAMLKFLRRTMNRKDITVHGFRSTFRDWAAEVSNYPRELAEASLAHVLADKTEAAYQRGDLLEKRREMMESWAGYTVVKYSNIFAVG